MRLARPLVAGATAVAVVGAVGSGGGVGHVRLHLSLASG